MEPQLKLEHGSSPNDDPPLKVEPTELKEEPPNAGTLLKDPPPKELPPPPKEELLPPKELSEKDPPAPPITVWRWELENELLPLDPVRIRWSVLC